MVQRGIPDMWTELAQVLLLKETMSWKVWYPRYLKTAWWKRLRRKVLLRDGNACVLCKSTASLHVDHIRYNGFGNEKKDDLQTLCYRCHAEKTKKYDLEAGKNFGSKKVVVGGETQLFTVLRRR